MHDGATLRFRNVPGGLRPDGPHRRARAPDGVARPRGDRHRTPVHRRAGIRPARARQHHRCSRLRRCRTRSSALDRPRSRELVSGRRRQTGHYRLSSRNEVERQDRRLGDRRFPQPADGRRRCYYVERAERAAAPASPNPVRRPRGPAGWGEWGLSLPCAMFPTVVGQRRRTVEARRLPLLHQTRCTAMSRR